MYTQSNDDEMIVTVGEKDFDKVKEFIASLHLEDHFADIIQILKRPEENAYDLETTDNEKLLVIFGKEKIHLILKKNKRYEQLKDKLFSYIHF